MDKEILKGSIDILLLSIIKQHDTYGYEIIQKLKENSNDLYTMSQGTLYPALKRLEQKDLINSYWGESETGMKRKILSHHYERKENFRRKTNSVGFSYSSY